MLPLFSCCFILLSASYPPEFSTVFTTGDGGYANIRIPSLVTTQAGTLLAFAEGRTGRRSDQANNHIIFKRSLDLGKTWNTVQVVAEDGANSLNNPCAVVDSMTRRVYLMYQRIPAGLSEGSKDIADGYEGPKVYRTLLTWSDDDGRSWQPPVDITRSVKHPTAVKTLCSGPGIGIQLTRGRHKGRMIIPFNEGPYGLWNNYAVHSDDHGKTWTAGQDAPGAMVEDSAGRPHSQVNEVQMAELSDGSVILNSRQFAGAKVRKVAISRDGGGTWSRVSEQTELRDPSCMGSLLRYRFPKGRASGILLYSGPDSAQRDHGTVYMSTDDGRTWPTKRLLVPGDFAYSVLTRLPNGDVGCLFETADYNEIRFVRFEFGWIAGQ